MSCRRLERYMVGMSAHLGTIPRARILAFAILGVSVGAIAMAFIAQYVFGLEPCVLCLYQRVPFAIAAALAALALLSSARGPMSQWLTTACGVVFLAGSALAFYHVGVEQHWWRSVAACGGELSTGVSVKDLAAQLAASPRKPCDEVDWRLFGLSLAGYNVLVSFALGVGTIVCARYLGRPVSRKES